MWKLNFYLYPSRGYQKITCDDACNLQDVLDYLEKTEHVFIPNTFYDWEDHSHITAAEFLYGEMQTDISDYLLEIISKRRHSKETYEDISKKLEYGYVVISKSDIMDTQKEVCVYCVFDRIQETYIESNDVVKVKRHYIKKVKTYEEYERKSKGCFPNLIFHPDAFQSIKRLGKCELVREELTRHLEILNDVGKRLYDYYGKKEKSVLSELESGYHIICSGKGSNEKSDFHKDMEYEGVSYTLTCNAHTKLYKKKTDQRIYFCWGRDEIEQHKIIIVKIGNHWDI